jgi:two-component system sensor histidine kinase RegB
VTATPPMPIVGANPLGLEARAGAFVAGSVSMRTITTIRWVGLSGQLAAVAVIQLGFAIPLPIEACLVVIAASALVNIVSQARQRRHLRLSDRAAALSLGFDIAQLSAMLYLTGGLANPFSLLILAPVTVSATILSFHATIWLCGAAASAATLLAFWHWPLPWYGGSFHLPELYIYGLWSAIVIALVFIAAYTFRVAEEARRMSAALVATRMALSREQRFSELGALAAAAAHELGSPLSTIAVIATELSREVRDDEEVASDIKGDIALLKSESDRCRDILARLSREAGLTRDQPFPTLPLTAVVDMAIAGLGEPGPEAVGRDGEAPVAIVVLPRTEARGREPSARRTNEMIHGLSTLMQNARQFARGRVEVTAGWSETEVGILVEDDGPGFPLSMLDRIGEPYVSTRAGRNGHMGLGIFIATTLLGHTGAEVRFANRPQGGASVQIRWPRRAFEAD